jgi:hypothetical protein
MSLGEGVAADVDVDGHVAAAHRQVELPVATLSNRKLGGTDYRQFKCRHDGSPATQPRFRKAFSCFLAFFAAALFIGSLLRLLLAVLLLVESLAHGCTPDNGAVRVEPFHRHSNTIITMLISGLKMLDSGPKAPPVSHSTSPWNMGFNQPA